MSVSGSNDPNWKLGGNHSARQWAAKMAKRGWADQQIGEAIVGGRRLPATNLVHPENPATLRAPHHGPFSRR